MKLIKDLGMLKPKETSKYTVRHGMYECPTCLKHFKVITASVKSGRSTQCNSCGVTKSSTTHGRSKTSPNYQRWEQMKQRCLNPNSAKYSYYGGKGITICPKWLKDFSAYEDYIMSLPNAGKPGYTVDRIEGYKDYIEGNLRWASKRLQARNTKTTVNSKSGVNGVTWDTRRGKWFVSITVDKKMKNLGRFDDLNEAIKVRKNAEAANNWTKD